MNRHTPGPWHARPLAGDLSGASLGFISFGGTDRVGTITVNDNLPECKANAALIIAAPNMLAVLQSIHDATFIVGLDINDEIGAAIAKATGTAP